MTNNVSLPLLGFAAFSGTGKTTLLEALLPKLTEAGLRIGLLKHAHHDFDVDKPGKDSYRLRKAGASQMLISSRNRHALMTETPESEAEFDYLLSRFDQSQLDLLLVEGCKNIAFPKVELHRKALDKPWLYPNDDNIIAVACDEALDTELPQLDLNNIDEIAQFVVAYVDLERIKHDNPPSTQQKSKPAECCDTLSPATMSVTQGQQKILSLVEQQVSTETLSLKQCVGKVLAKDIVSPINVPQYTNSAMDGFAIRSKDIGLASFEIVAEVMAGHAYSGEVKTGQAVKIMTGAPMPADVDTVIMREQANEVDGVVSFTTDNIKAKQNVRSAGEDLASGQAVFTAGTRIQAPELGMMASLGFGQCEVLKPIKVALFSTGDEVLEAGEEQVANTIYDSNRYTLFAQLERMGCDIVDYGILEDNEQVMIDCLEKAASECDMVITSGGVSVGDADYIKLALDKLGSIDFWRINMRPGRPLAFGKINEKPFFGLPGNPVAVMVSFINFVEPALRKMQGEENWQALKVQAIAAENLRSRQGRTEFSRGVYSTNEVGQLVVRTTGKQGSGILRSMSEANCLIEISPAVDTVKEGESVTIIPLQGRL
ncbi:bifunctional molybdopterin-guanine dinucleotide biosynthesis adaptor protein MobB/molybdopterin molybdotransferase MoeA [Vibrio maerlii]|uniref:bifunctional molybdopterin-guanine dinucleotide biosynthesis adaptor protein MobB/molybdopterin molybdotransferase MoeA n=1 Tax=Vibrio maerlii TaxID=2231648 RepID=UPI000E3D589F|nr:bifunctional molybdopterin-guanine dinucleotide biosynthesis adaptor protein MobB/molybdopterin molybdotransferase MoeA [Vibrio maerlii]